MFSLKRFFFSIIRAGHSRGFGIQSPFAYSFVREVARGVIDIKIKKSIPLENVSKEELRILRFYQRLDIFLHKQDNINDVLIIEGIHQSRSSLRRWNELINDKSVTVSFDLYDCGVLFFDLNLYKRNYKVMLR